MTIYSVIVIWLLAPLLELGVIVWLLAERDKYKRLLEQSGGNKMLPIKPAQSNRAESGYRKVSSCVSYGSWPVQVQNIPQTVPVISQEPKVAAGIQESRVQEAGTQESRAQEAGTQESRVQEPRLQETTARKERQPRDPGLRKNSLGTAALILGMVFIVLAGVIFATTTWRIMPDSSKVLLIFASAVLFFGASGFAKKCFGIRKTSNAFYLLGSIFLFLSVVAAAYFQVLGTEFVLLGINRWKVLWVGSLVLEGAFLVGIKGFKERMYVQASLWGMSVSMLFLAKAVQVSWADFISLMTLYAFALILFNLKCRKISKTEKSAGMVFAYLHFWIFGTASMIWSFLAVCEAVSFTALGLAALITVTAGMRSLRRGEIKSAYEIMYILAVVELCLYAPMFLGEFIFSAELIAFILLFGFSLWDIWKKDGLELPLLLMGGFAPVYFYLEQGTDVWWFVYTLFLAIYLFRYRRNASWRNPALSASACLFVLAFWGQSFIAWPEVIALECHLLPAALWIWAMGEVWGKSRELRLAQSAGYLICLGILVWDAYRGGLLVDALLAEGCCLAVFVFNQIKKDVWWVRISGCLMLLMALSMTKEFWMSISWWVYLLAAGLGLILFAAVTEKKKP